MVNMPTNCCFTLSHKGAARTPETWKKIKSSHLQLINPHIPPIDLSFWHRQNVFPINFSICLLHRRYRTSFPPPPNNLLWSSGWRNWVRRKICWQRMTRWNVMINDRWRIFGMPEPLGIPVNKETEFFSFWRLAKKLGHPYAMP